MNNADIRIRDPYVFTDRANGRYLLFGTTDADCWHGPGQGFDLYSGTDLESWSGPFPAFRPEPGFWGKRNFWAPEIHAYLGRFCMFASFISDSRRRGTQILMADRPEGPYTPLSAGPATPEAWDCLDGTLHIDEAGNPWIVFCHEWVQCIDGEIRACRLDPESLQPAGEPVLLFRASEARWTRAPRSPSRTVSPESRVTDGPFLWRPSGSGPLLLIWSSFSDSGYALALARSPSGRIEGPWIHAPTPIADRDSGHAMLFTDLAGKLRLAMHSPNTSPAERPHFPLVHGCEDTLHIEGWSRPDANRPRILEAGTL